jgi:hypothetical protein
MVCGEASGECSDSESEDFWGFDEEVECRGGQNVSISEDEMDVSDTSVCTTYDYSSGDASDPESPGR